ncbi:MAG: hypothetical protein HIU83_14840, partial [Proteobacteria bacterium]|nr:hypothetical protein [Pseudomonadota bacterium]
QVAWKSSDSNVVTITTTGLVTAFNPGTVTITATLNGITGSTNLIATAGVASIASDHLVMAKLKPE